MVASNPMLLRVRKMSYTVALQITLPRCCTILKQVLPLGCTCENRFSKDWVLPIATTSSGRRSVPNQRVHPLQVVLRRNLLLILSQFIIPHNSIPLPLSVFSFEVRERERSIVFCLSANIFLARVTVYKYEDVRGHNS